jgi:hypothetical protein
VANRPFSERLDCSTVALQAVTVAEPHLHQGCLIVADQANNQVARLLSYSELARFSSVPFVFAFTSVCSINSACFDTMQQGQSFCFSKLSS